MARSMGRKGDGSGSPAETETVERLRFLGLAGSLRHNSLNRCLLRNARRLAPERLQIDVFDLAAVPFYNGDLDDERNRPAAVEELKRAIAESDGLLLVTPEYNHGIPGVLKNAIDWASRPAGRSPLRGKPVAIMGAAAGAFGTVRAQQQLKLVMLSTLALLLPHPGVLVAHAREKFTSDGRLIHEPTEEHLRLVLEEIADLTEAHLELRQGR